jgi:hypothetical protein
MFHPQGNFYSSGSLGHPQAAFGGQQGFPGFGGSSPLVYRPNLRAKGSVPRI